MRDLEREEEGGLTKDLDGSDVASTTISSEINGNNRAQRRMERGWDGWKKDGNTIPQRAPVPV